jgi:hypothetical protein
MKKLRFLLGFGIIAGALMSCQPETIPADGDGNADGKYTVNYGVQVIPIGNVERGATNASVTIQTQNGITTKTVGADGIAVFEGLNAGTISGYVSAPGFASVNFKATCASYNIDVNTQGYVSSTVYIPAKNGAVAGRLRGDFDQDGDYTLGDNGNFQALNLKVKYAITGAYPMGTGDGALSQVSLDVNTYADVTTNTGTFLMDNLPNTDLGYFSATIHMDNLNLVSVSAPPAQVIYQWGPYALSLVPGETQEWGDLVIP